MFDLLVIGAGPGGYTVAARAAKLGLSTAIVEERSWGGTCLNRGCVPTKTLLHASEVYRRAADGAAIGIHAMKKRPQSFMMTLTNLPNTMPDIVTGISLMLLFLFTKVDRGYVTMLLAHITFDTPYVILSVLPKLKQMNRHTYEAALDLGATPMYALFHVIIPECMPGIITGAMLAFTLSLDDFTISYFTTSPLVQNLSTLIYSAARRGIEPTLNALSALMFVALLVLLLIVNRRTASNND